MMSIFQLSPHYRYSRMSALAQVAKAWITCHRSPTVTTHKKCLCVVFLSISAHGDYGIDEVRTRVCKWQINYGI